MPDEAVHAFCNRLVESGLQSGRSFLPLRPNAGHALGGHNRLAISVRGAGRLLEKESLLILHAMCRRGSPILGLWKGADSQRFESIDRRAVRSAGLRMDSEPILRRQLREWPIVSAYNQVAHSPAQIVEKAAAALAVVHDAPGHYRKIGQQIVAAASAELVPESGRPVQSAQFPTVGHQVFQGAAQVRTRDFQKRGHVALPVILKY